jgi:murein DD-endopeptidase MepM/ murein hydrolase activator NlpD
VRRQARHPAHWALRGVLLAAGLTVLGVVTGKTLEGGPEKATLAGSLSESSVVLLKLQLPEITPAIISEPAPSETAPATEFWQTVTVRSGDSLSAIFDRTGVSPRTLYRIMQLGDDIKALKRIHPGDEMELQLDGDGQLVALKYQPNEIRTLRIKRRGDDYALEIEEHALERRVVHRSGVIDESLFQGAQSAGVSEGIVMEMAEIFGWDIDFALDIREGDRFTVLYDEVYKDGRKIADGDILAAEFVNQGRPFRAIRYTDPSGKTGYFTPEGKNVKKAFLRSPVKFSRISSRFTLKRWHPVLKRWRAHRGVDYAAPTGTPVRAAGEGKVTFAGSKGGYGNAVFIQHGGSYTTVYGHLSRFGRGIRSGTRVRQGRIIGYVGSTGLATGPHLHFEFRVNGVHRNPLTVKLPDGKPVAPEYWDHFRAKTLELADTLELLDRSFLAANEF